MIDKHAWATQGGQDQSEGTRLHGKTLLGTPVGVSGEKKSFLPFPFFPP